MAWTEITRRKYRRDGLRYASDTTDAEWAMIQPLLPPASPLGRPRATDLRAVVNAIFYIASTGCQWRQLPKVFPLFDGAERSLCVVTLRRVGEHQPRFGQAAREQAGREASPTAGVIDSQSVKTTESGGPRGFDAGKKINESWPRKFGQ